jgi:uncharacterized membrane protein YfcA
LFSLGVVAVAFVIAWARSLSRRHQWLWPSKYSQLIGFVTNFFDTLGIGSYATTTAIYRLKSTVADDHLPGTLNIGHCLPIILQAFIYVSIVEVDEWTLVLLIGSAVLGAWLGAGCVIRLSRRSIQFCLGLALLVAAAMLLGRFLDFLPAGGNSLALYGPRLLIGIVGNFVFGALMMIGVGAYAPVMIMVSLLDMNPKAAFPIMMGSCAFLTPVGSLRFLQKAKYNASAALGLTLGGLPAVLLAAYLVRELPLDFVRGMVVLIAVYTSVGLLRAAYLGETAPRKHEIPAACPSDGIR